MFLSMHRTRILYSVLLMPLLSQKLKHLRTYDPDKYVHYTSNISLQEKFVIFHKMWPQDSRFIVRNKMTIREQI